MRPTAKPHSLVAGAKSTAHGHQRTNHAEQQHPRSRTQWPPHPPKKSHEHTQGSGRHPHEEAEAPEHLRVSTQPQVSEDGKNPRQRQRRPVRFVSREGISYVCVVLCYVCYDSFLLAAAMLPEVVYCFTRAPDLFMLPYSVLGVGLMFCFHRDVRSS